MTAYLTECIVGLLAMAALFVWVGKNDPVVNYVTIGKQFTNGRPLTTSDIVNHSGQVVYGKPLTNGDIATKKRPHFCDPHPLTYTVSIVLTIPTYLHRRTGGN